jgi:hypothetical protein
MKQPKGTFVSILREFRFIISSQQLYPQFIEVPIEGEGENALWADSTIAAKEEICLHLSLM